METKTVALDREAYEFLRKRKKPGESFSDVVKRLAAPRRPIADFAGIWKDIPRDEFRKIVEAIRKARELDLERMDRLLKRW